MFSLEKMSEIQHCKICGGEIEPDNLTDNQSSVIRIWVLMVSEGSQYPMYRFILNACIYTKMTNTYY